MTVLLATSACTAAQLRRYITLDGAFPDQNSTNLIEELWKAEKVVIPAWYSHGKSQLKGIPGRGNAHQRAATFIERIGDRLRELMPLLKYAKDKQDAIEKFEALRLHVLGANPIELAELFAAMEEEVAEMGDRIRPSGSALLSSLLEPSPPPRASENHGADSDLQPERSDVWDFSNPVCATFRGILCTISGKARIALKLLAESRHGMTREDLARALATDPEDPIDDGTVRWHIGNVRKALKRTFETAGKDPVPCIAKGRNCAWKIDTSVLGKPKRFLPGQ
jgi:hypothetical protein